MSIKELKQEKKDIEEKIEILNEERDEILQKIEIEDGTKEDGTKEDGTKEDGTKEDESLIKENENNNSWINIFMVLMSFVGIALGVIYVISSKTSNDLEYQKQNSYIGR